MFSLMSSVNSLRPRQNGRHFPDDTFKRIFMNENVRISINISLKFVPKVPINNISALVQIMAWRRPGDKPLSETMMVGLPTHICVTRLQWVNTLRPRQIGRHSADHIPSSLDSGSGSSSAFSWIKIFEFRLKFHWSLFLRVQLTIIQHCFR